jgi:hypothetical protein
VGADDPEGRLMSYYSSTLAFSPLGGALGLVAAETRTSAAVGLELSLVPRLSSAQRSVIGDKPEATNLAPMFARPRATLALGHGVSFEGSWIPPVRTFGVRANIGALALSLPAARWRGFSLAPRLSVLAGKVRGVITCDPAMGGRGQALATYYALVCHGHASDDWFEPRHASAEAVFWRAMRGGAVRPYLAAGVRHERTRFDIGVIRGDGSRDADEPVLAMRATRGYATAGVAWRGGRPLGAAEVYWAPGSLVTARVMGGVRLW